MNVSCVGTRKRYARRVPRRSPGLAAAVACLALQWPALGSSPASPEFAIEHVRVFDGQRVIPDQTVVVRDGLIASVGSARAPGGLPRITADGATLLPGLIDAHTHTDSPEQLAQALRFGVTTCLDMTTSLARLGTLRSAAASRSDVADFRSAGILATAPGGHGTEFSRNPGLPTVADASAAAAFVAARKAEGSDYLKVVLNGMRAMRRGIPTLAPDTAKALVAGGHAHGMLVVAHIESPDDAATVVNGGIDGLAHVWRGSGANPALAALIAARGVFVIPTLSVPDSWRQGTGVAVAADARVRPYLTDEALRRLETPPPDNPLVPPFSQFLEATRSLVAAGVTIVAGTDTGATNLEWRHGVALHRELELYVQAGLTPLQALQAATSNAADRFRLSDRGRIAVGRRADLLLVRGDPISDIAATRDILRVWKAGIELDRPRRAVVSR